MRGSFENLYEAYNMYSQPSEPKPMPLLTRDRIYHFTNHIRTRSSVLGNKAIEEIAWTRSEWS